MAVNSDTDSSNSIRGYSSWRSYYSRRTGGDSVATHAEIAKLAESAVNDPVRGGGYLAAYGEKVVLLVPGDYGVVRMVHQAFYDSKNQNLIGISGMGGPSPFVEFEAGSLSENMTLPKSRPRGGGVSRIRMPSYSNFTGLEPGEFLSAVGDSSSDTVSSYVRRVPNYFVAHLDTIDLFDQNGKDALAEELIEAIVVGREGPNRAPIEDLERKYGQLLRFLWLVGKEIGKPAPLEPVDVTGDPELAERLAATRGKLSPQPVLDSDSEDSRSPRRSEDSYQGHSPRGRGGHLGGRREDSPDRRPQYSQYRTRKSRGRSRTPRRRARTSSGRGSDRSRSQRERSSGRRERSRSRRYRSSSSRRSERRSNDRHSSRRSPRSRYSYSSSSRDRRGRRGRRSYSSSPARPSRRRSRSPSVRMRYSERHRSRSRSRSRRGGGYSHRRSRSRSREGIAASSSLSQEEVVRGMLQINQLLGASQVEQRAREAKKRSVLGKFDDEQRALFDLLAAESFDDKNPRMCSEARRFFEDKDLAHLQGVVNGWQRRWGGTVRTNALVQFTSAGYLAPDSPGGFTVFMMSPKKERPRQEQKARERALRRQFNDNDDIDDSDIKYYAKSDYFVTETLDQATTQLEMACDFLDKVSRKGSIASAGYEWALSFLRKNKGRCEECFERDPHFPVRFLHTTDSVFQLFCTNLLEYRHRSHPIRAAKRELQFFMQDLLRDKFRDILLGSLPRLELPRRLPLPDEDNPDNGKKLGGRRPPGGGGGERGDKAQYENPDGVPEKWKLPESVRVIEVFDRGTQKGMQNSALLPTVKHHLNGKQVLLCPKYALIGICRRRCELAHLPTRKLSTDQEASVDKAVAAIKKTSS